MSVSKLMGALKSVATFFGYVGKITAAWPIVILVFTLTSKHILWPVIGPYFTPFIELPQTVATLAQSVEELTKSTSIGFDKYGRQIADLRDEIDELKVQPKIVEYDLRYSRVRGGKCVIGGDYCNAEFRFRRTPDGLLCDKPVAQYWVSNHFGDTRPAEDVSSTIVRADEEWVIVPVRFRLPPGVLPGRGSFFIRLEYTNCPWSSPGGIVKEATPKLQFEIIASDS